MNRPFLTFGALALLLSSLIASHPSPVAAQEPKDKAVKVRWFGQSFFQIESAEGRKIVIDPHAIPAFGRQSPKAEFILITHAHDDHALVEIVETEKAGEKFKEADVYRGVEFPRRKPRRDLGPTCTASPPGTA